MKVAHIRDDLLKNMKIKRDIEKLFQLKREKKQVAHNFFEAFGTIHHLIETASSLKKKPLWITDEITDKNTKMTDINFLLQLMKFF